MTDHYSPKTLNEFLQVLLKSQLLDGDVLKSALNDFRENEAENIPKDELRAFASYLIVHEYLTCWQCDKLRKGQFKGFFLDDYVFRDHVDCDDKCTRYVAEDIRTGKYVILAITPRYIKPLKNGKPHYRIEDYNA
ncbi:MAG: hypothetical protein JXM70_16480 [Pirellulales bacterium]|nr:hypothetical protein [Pirellulales bacterium]